MNVVAFRFAQATQALAVIRKAFAQPIAKQLLQV